MVEFQRPSRATIEYFYNGIVALLPTYAITAFGLPKDEYAVQRNYRGITDPEDFKALLLKSIYDERGRHPSSLQDAVAIVARWHEGGGVDSNVPKNIDDLVKELDEQDAGYKKALASKKLLLEAQRAAEEAEKTSQATIEPNAPSEAESKEIKGPENIPVEEEAPAQSGTGPMAEPSAIGIKISYAKTDAGAQFRAQSRTATTRWVVARSYEKMRQADPEKAAAISMWAHGITSAHLENKIQDLPDKHALELEKIIRAIQGLETDPIQTAIIRQSFPIKDIDFILGPESGVTQSEMMVFFNPPDGGGAYVPQGGSFLGNMAWSVAQQFTAKAITKQVTGLLAKAGTQAAVTAGAEVATTATGAAVGAGGGAAAGAAAGTAIPVPILGTLIGLVIGFIVGVLFSVAEKLALWLKKNARDVLFGGVAVLAYGGFIGSPVLIASGLGLGALSALNGGLSGTGKQAGGLGSTAIGGLTSMVWPALGVPFLIAAIAVPAIIAIIIFIINAGAFLVPPKTATVPYAENPYIALTKTVTPGCRNRSGTGCVAGFPDVTYTVTVKAKKGTLTNIRFDNQYTVVGKSLSVTAPAVPEFSAPPSSISPTQDFTFAYRLSLGSQFDDTVVTDILTLTADAPGQAGVSVATSASVVTGNPPIDCPLLGGSPLWYSYVAGDEDGRRHGNNRYWGSSGCNSWSLPQGSGCYGPSDPRASSNKCYNNSSGTCSYYGYAVDVFYGTEVYLPRVGGQSLTWACNYAYPNSGGSAGHTYHCRSGQYSLVLTHMKNGGRTGTINSGERIGELYQMGGDTHLHIEFAINGQFVKPETYFCTN